MADKITAMFESGEVDIDNVFFPDETWMETGVGGRVIKQNDRKYFDVKKQDVMNVLEQGKAQRYPGIMLHLTVSPFGGWAMSTPFFFSQEERVTAEAYVSLFGGT